MNIQDSLFRIGTNILIYIFQEKETIISHICQDIGIVPTTATNYIDIFENEGIITTKKQGSVRTVKITEKGNKIARKLNICIKEL